MNIGAFTCLLDFIEVHVSSLVYKSCYLLLNYFVLNRIMLYLNKSFIVSFGPYQIHFITMLLLFLFC